ncbi:MAG: hypothetical protein QXF82_06865, partial [Nitrososphaeria archaeon]
MLEAFQNGCYSWWTASKCGSKRTFIKIISRILQNILWMRMPKKKVKKRLIEPKVRLLLWIYL